MKNLKHNKYWQCPHCDGIQIKPKIHTSTTLSKCQICNKKTADMAIIAGQYNIDVKGIDINRWNQERRQTKGQDIRNARIAYMALAGFLIVSLLLYLQFMNAANSIVCANPEYKQVTIGMTDEEVLKLMGPPQKKELSTDKQTREVWIYQIPDWKGTISLRFNQERLLARRNCS